MLDDELDDLLNGEENLQPNLLDIAVADAIGNVLKEVGLDFREGRSLDGSASLTKGDVAPIGIGLRVCCLRCDDPIVAAVFGVAG